MRWILWWMLVGLLAVPAFSRPIDDLCAAARAGDLPRVTQLLTSMPMLASACDGHGKSALVYAVQAGHADLVRTLYLTSTDTALRRTGDTRAVFYDALPAPYLAERQISMVPLQAIAAWFGADMRVDAAAGTATLTFNKHHVRLHIDSTDAWYDDTAVVLPTAPTVVEGNLYVPLRVFVDGMRIIMLWDTRWLQAILFHPLTGNQLVIALADPDAADPHTVRAAVAKPDPVVFVQVHEPILGTPNEWERFTTLFSHVTSPLILFQRRNGQLQDAQSVDIRSQHFRETLKCYVPTRYVGATRISYAERTLSTSSAREAIIGFSGDWNAMPRQPRLDDPAKPMYQQALRTVLDREELREAPVRITRVYVVDLDGDGTDEVLLSAAYVAYAQEFRRDDYQAPSCFYSLVLIGHEIDGVLVPFYTGGMCVTAPTDIYRYLYFLGALDVDGDGHMEVLTAENSSWTGRAVVKVKGSTAETIVNSGWGE